MIRLEMGVVAFVDGRLLQFVYSCGCIVFLLYEFLGSVERGMQGEK